MKNSIKSIVNATPFKDNNDTRKIFRVIGTVDIDGKGTEHPLSDVDPMIFLDEAEISGNIPETFHKHPHCGLAAISYLLSGEFVAWDNINGNAFDANRAGGVYYVDSGRGVVHGEAASPGKRDGRWLQLWINPGVDKTPLPQASYQLFQPQELPVFQDAGLWVKVVVGKAFQLSSPLVSGCPLQYLHVKLSPNSATTIPLDHPEWQGFVYMLNGQGEFGHEKQIAHKRQCLVLNNDLESLTVSSLEEELEFVLVRGKPHGKPFYKLLGHGGALVGNSKEELYSKMKIFESDPEKFGI